MIAYAETLTPVAQSSSDWSWLIVLAIIAAAATILIYAHRRWPSQSAKVETQAKADLAKALGDLRVWLATRLADKTGATEEAPAEPAPAPPVPGKQGQPGPLTIQCTGDPKADNAAWQSAYFS